MTMLRSILLSNSTPTCAIIQDDNCVKGTRLFKAILKNDIENNSVKEIHLITCENPPEYYLGGNKNPKVLIHNLFQDPNCWLQKNKSPCDVIFEEVLSCQESPSSVLIDSLNFLILLKNEYYTYSTIHKLKRQFKVTCLLHRDEITCNDTVKKFMFLSKIYLSLHENKSKESGHTMDDKKKMLVEGIQVKPSGKLSRFKEIINVDENFQLYSEVYEIARHDGSCFTIKDNFKNITFRLGLDIQENEKKARDNLVLPYLRSQKGDSKTDEDEGKIVYYAESEDDLEEDPDDDLDI